MKVALPRIYRNSKHELPHLPYNITVAKVPTLRKPTAS